MFKLRYADTNCAVRAGQHSNNTRGSECILVKCDLLDNDSHFLGCAKIITRLKMNTVITIRLTTPSANYSLYFLKIERSSSRDDVFPKPDRPAWTAILGAVVHQCLTSKINGVRRGAHRPFPALPCVGRNSLSVTG